ncbi:archaetidylserine decarboxylase [Fictibacillus nanhaiensis]|uniref:archaetidylserine decarboxylase n=1 Tax=Fictibacillus nanhaiensis TaxID=742169 RepID=UPI001C98B266|nr:archaetidylserine decarboxylase [Fictibacillus nanhaiensis]MBY6035932.1 archaetidylserine decarboxylase [Fictibacillus nanhaiensis]
MRQRVARLVLTLLPQNKISSIIGKAGRSKLSKRYVKRYAKHYKINLSEIEKPIHEYAHLTEFFSRKLKEDARPICGDEMQVISPVDGLVTQMGRIDKGTIIQAKGISYPVQKLLAEENKTGFESGHFITIYLSPKDYHRIHMPIKGEVYSSTYIPGRLFPVNDIGVNHVKGLFTKNERVVTFAETDFGKLAIVKVGAFIVGSVKVKYDEKVRRWKKIMKTSVSPVVYEKGEEVGHFEFGSTVILLFEDRDFSFKPSLQVGSPLQMGEIIGQHPASSKKGKYSATI